MGISIPHLQRSAQTLRHQIKIRRQSASQIVINPISSNLLHLEYRFIRKFLYPAVFLLRKILLHFSNSEMQKFIARNLSSTLSFKSSMTPIKPSSSMPSNDTFTRYIFKARIRATRLSLETLLLWHPRPQAWFLSSGSSHLVKTFAPCPTALPLPFS